MPKHAHSLRPNLVWRSFLQLRASSDCLALVQGGNNNTYCHDSPLNWFDWDQAASDAKGFARYFQCLVNFRWGRLSADTNNNTDCSAPHFAAALLRHSSLHVPHPFTGSTAAS